MTHDEDTPPAAAKVGAWLRDIPELCALLDDAAVTKGPSAETARPAPGSRPPLRLDVVHLQDEREKHDWESGMWWCDPDRQGVLPYLHGWARDIEATAYEERPTLPDELPAEPTVASVCAWLLAEVDYAVTLPQWPEFAAGVATVHSRLRAATGAVRPMEARPVPCRACGGPLRPRAGRAASWQCEACERVVTVQAVTLVEAAPLVGVSKTTLYRWALRPGVLSPVVDGAKKLYDLGDIRRLVAETRLRGVGA